MEITFDSSLIMNGLPFHLLDEILFKLEAKTQAIMRCTNKYFQSYLSDPRFEKHSIWVRPCLFNVSSYGDTYIFCQPLVSSCDSMSPGKKHFVRQRCHLLGSCSGLLLLYIDALFVANPLTKRFRLVDDSESTLLPTIIGDDSYPVGHFHRTERLNCAGFAVKRNQTTKSFKIACILEMRSWYEFEIVDGDLLRRQRWTLYGFEIIDGESLRHSTTTITTSSEFGLTTGMKPAYLDDTLHWLRNDGSIIAFNPETEQARIIPSIFHQEPDMKLFFAADDKINRLALLSLTKEAISVYTLLENSTWTLVRRIKNVYMKEIELECWHMVAYDGKCLVVRERKDCLRGVVHVYDMEANSWRVLGSTTCWSSNVQDFYKFTPSLFFVEEDEQQKVLVAANDHRISHLTAIMGLIDTTK